MPQTRITGRPLVTAALQVVRRCTGRLMVRHSRPVAATQCLHQCCSPGLQELNIDDCSDGSVQSRSGGTFRSVQRPTNISSLRLKPLQGLTAAILLRCGTHPRSITALQSGGRQTAGHLHASFSYLRSALRHSSTWPSGLLVKT